MAKPAENPHTVCHIEVIYNSDGFGHIPEINGKSNELIDGQGGANVYLRALKSQNTSAALTDVRIAHEDIERSNRHDLAKGTRGDYVYLKETADKNNRVKISDVSLLRSDDPLSLSEVKARGLHGISNDINSGRGHGYLYVIRRTMKT